MKATIQTCILSLLCIASGVFAEAQCPAGQYGPPCTPCPPGSYCPGDGNKYLCTGGTYQPNSGSTSCFGCPPSSGGNVQGATMITQCFLILPVDLLYFKAEIQ